MKSRILLAAATVISAAAACGDVTITVDPAKPPYKDQRKSRTAPDIGYAGSIADMGMFDGFDEFFVKNPDKTWETFKAAGAHFVKEWEANRSWQIGMAYAALKTDVERREFVRKFSEFTWASVLGDPKVSFDWRQKHGVKVLLCLEQGSVFTNVAQKLKSNDIKDVKRVILDFVRWIVDNGYKDQVAGFELGNEPYWGQHAEECAARWSEIVPEIKRIFPEADIGFPLAEYRVGDPDVAAVRARSTDVNKWFDGPWEEFGFQRLNQWSGRFIVAFSNGIDYCSHVIYHYYGAYGTYGVGPCGYSRIENFAKVFPEIKDKRVWITEWRDCSDEDNRIQQMHGSSIFKAHYMLSTICQPNIDGICLHSAIGLAGGFAVADGRGSWLAQFDPGQRNYTDPDCTGRPRLEVGPVGPVFKLYSEALLKHPLIYDHGVFDTGTIGDGHYWSGNIFFGKTLPELVKWHWAGSDPAKMPPNHGNAEWTLVINPEKTSAALLVCNSMRRVWRPTLKAKGYGIGKLHYRMFRCREDQIALHQVPGEPRPTWEEEYDGEAAQISVPEFAIATITFPIRRKAGVK